MSLLVAFLTSELPLSVGSCGGVCVVFGAASARIHFRGRSMAWRQCDLVVS